MIASEVLGAYFQSILSRSFAVVEESRCNAKVSPSIDPPYPVHGGIFRDEAIMLLRRFYIQENEKGMKQPH